MSTLKFRFVFNRKTGANTSGRGGTKGADNFARLVVQDVAFTYSEALYDKLRRDIAQRMTTDIDRELQHMAGLFMKNVIGIGGRNRGPNGTMTAVAPKAAGFTQSLAAATNNFGGWARRSAAYLRWRHRRDWKSRSERHKSDRGIDPPWFRRNKPSVLDKMRSAGTWTSAYGGFSVSVKRWEQFKLSDPAVRGYDGTRLAGTKGGHTRVGVGTIRVQAMRRITPEMLPASDGGALNNFGSRPQGSGLLSLLGSDVANRLGGDPKHVPFRPTIQPFLGFFLSRQLPNAVLKRLEQGFDAKLLNDGTGSAGRREGAKATAAKRAGGIIPHF